MHTILLASLCFAGFSFMLNCAVQLTLEERQDETLYSLILESKVLQAILVFISASYFISNGVSIDTWLVIGLLSWVLATHLMLGMTLNDPRSGMLGAVFAIISGLLIALGTAQASLITVDWVLSSQYGYALCGITLISLSAFLWWSSIGQLIRNFGNNSNDDLF